MPGPLGCDKDSGLTGDVFHAGALGTVGGNELWWRIRVYLRKSVSYLSCGKKMIRTPKL